MIEIKEVKEVCPGYALEDVISVERANARMCVQIEQLHRAFMDRERRFELYEQVELIFGWNTTKTSI